MRDQPGVEAALPAELERAQGWRDFWMMLRWMPVVMFLCMMVAGAQLTIHPLLPLGTVDLLMQVLALSVPGTLLVLPIAGFAGRRVDGRMQRLAGMLVRMSAAETVRMEARRIGVWRVRCCSPTRVELRRWALPGVIRRLVGAMCVAMMATVAWLTGVPGALQPYPVLAAAAVGAFAGLLWCLANWGRVVRMERSGDAVCVSWWGGPALVERVFIRRWRFGRAVRLMGVEGRLWVADGVQTREIGACEAGDLGVWRTRQMADWLNLHGFECSAP